MFSTYFSDVWREIFVANLEWFLVFQDPFVGGDVVLVDESCVFSGWFDTHHLYIVASCISSSHDESLIRIDLKGTNDRAPTLFWFLNSKMPSSITQKNSVQTLDNDWSTWPGTNEPHFKNKAVVRACWPLFSLKKASYWIKHWNPGSFQMLHISSGELAKHKYLAQARGVWQTQNWLPWDLWVKKCLLAMLFW